MVRFFCLGLFLVLIFVTSCDSFSVESVTEEVCRAGPGKNEASYFPTDVGRMWEYDYLERSRFNFDTKAEGIRGVMTWEIVSRTERCGAIQLMMHESFEGENYIEYLEEGVPDSTSPAQWERTFTATLDSVLTIPGFTNQPPDEISVATQQSPPLPWIYPDDAPFDVEEDVSVVCFFASCSRVFYTMRRDVGFVSWRFFETNRFASRSREIELRR
ncbi:MAG: hypothetical protein KTR29_20005 [Rhodothermaceae bacterium]|nr:hypothetical protein [Rhodothermaceae bacterium]